MDIIPVYLHGYGSSPMSEKAQALRQIFPNLEAMAIPVPFKEAEELLESWIQSRLDEGKHLMLVGTSLGGYWATRMSERFLLPAVIINPSCQPRLSLSKYPDAGYIEDYPDLEVTSGIPRILLLAKNDDVIDYRIAEKLFGDKVLVKVFEKGGHRFNEINTISTNMKELDLIDFTP